MKIETVQTDRFSMKYFRFGSGEGTMVILPGLSVQSVMDFAPAVAAAYRPLADAFSIYVFDRRADLPAACSVHDMARDTAEALRALGLRDVCLFGVSQGGMIALVLAVEHPDLVKKLALGSTAARVTASQYRVIETWVRLAEQRDRTGLYLAFGQAVYPPAMFEQAKAALTAAALTVTDEELTRFITLAKGAKSFDVTAELSGVRCPVLVLGAADDGVLGPDAASDLIARLKDRPDFSFHLYDGYGHAAYDTAPDYRDRLLRFFAP